MDSNTIKQASLDELKQKKNKGELHKASEHSVMESLPDNFWDSAEIISPPDRKSVHLKLTPEVFEFFKSGGKGHLTRMQNVLAAYVSAHEQSHSVQPKP